MKYAYHIITSENIALTSGESVILGDFWKELTEDEFNIFHNARHNKNKIIYADAEGGLHIKDKTI
jgi:hypothetical protein